MDEISTETAAPRLTAADIHEFRNALEPQIAPDGSRICFLLLRRDAATDRRATRLMLSAGAVEAGHWAEVAESDEAQSPVWAPDSRRIAYLRRAESETLLVVLDIASGAQSVIARARVPMRDPAWSRDGAALAWQQFVPSDPPDWLETLPAAPGGERAPPSLVTERLIYRHDLHGDLREGVYHVFVAGADGSAAPRPVSRGLWHGGFVHPAGLTWSADGSEILLASNPRAAWDVEPNDTDLFVLRIADGSVRRLTEMRGPVAMPALSPDGTRVAFTAVEWRGLSSQARHVYLVDFAGGEPVRVAPALDRSIDGLAWQGETALLVSYDETGRKLLSRIALDSFAVTPLLSDMGGSNIESPYSSGTFSVAANGMVVTTRSTAALPCEVALIGPEGKVTTLTALNEELAARVGGFAGAEEFWATAKLDGAAIQCWLQRPNHVGPKQGTGPAPLIMVIHGGPFACFGDRFSIKHQCFIAAGYAVLTINPRGSIGYGEEFANKLHDRHPGPDWQDLMDALDVALARGGIDADRLYVTGTSGGGVLTLWSVTHTHRFRSAVSIKPVVNQESWLLTADIGAMLGATWFAGIRPWDEPAKYRDRSPLAFAASVRTPTLLIVGETDHRTPASEAQQMFAALRLLGVPTALIRMPGVPHSTQAMRPSQFADEILATLSWFRRYP